MKKCLLFALTFVLFAGCDKKDSLSPIPKITFVSITPTTVRAGDGEEVIEISFVFEDGDADIDIRPDPGALVYVTSNRKGDTQEVAYPFPQIDESIRDPEKGLKGIATVFISAAFYLLDSTQTADTFNFSLYMKDLAGNPSNTINTPDIYLVH